ncbi:UNVERIFIED_CONTAM: hypothetical protein FKN15_040186 [Acipenser sinensis]
MEREREGAACAHKPDIPVQAAARRDRGSLQPSTKPAILVSTHSLGAALAVSIESKESPAFVHLSAGMNQHIGELTTHFKLLYKTNFDGERGRERRVPASLILVTNQTSPRRQLHVGTEARCSQAQNQRSSSVRIP